MAGVLFGPDITFLGVPRCDLADESTYADADIVILGAPLDGGSGLLRENWSGAVLGCSPVGCACCRPGEGVGRGEPVGCIESPAKLLLTAPASHAAHQCWTPCDATLAMR